MEPAEAFEHSPDAVEAAELARRVGAGSPRHAREAEEELCRRLAPRIRLYGLRHLRDEHAAADLVQDVLLVTLDGLRAGRLREPEKLASFVLGVCRMVVIEIRRAGARRARLLEQYRGDLPLAASPRPLLDTDRLRACLERLPARERSVIVMSFYEERGGDEVAHALDLSPANVRVIRHRAVGRLRDCLGGKQ